MPTTKPEQTREEIKAEAYAWAVAHIAQFASGGTREADETLLEHLAFAYVAGYLAGRRRGQ